jgi:hypothetical protein
VIVPNEARAHPLCKLPSDTFHLSISAESVSIPLLLPMCSPSKSTRHTLGSSGSVVGLAPSTTLARLSAPNLLQQLLEKRHVDRNLFSLTLLDAESGKLSLGGTIAEHIEEQKTRFQVRLDHLGNFLATPDFIDAEVRTRISNSFPPALNEQFRWVEVHGAEGWWTTLMGGVWINGVKTISDQPVLFDIQSPFILAPPAAARRFYQGIHATKRLPKPHDNMFAFPCLNQPNIAFEFARWLFPTLSGDVSMEERFDGPLGGKLSLGKLRNGTGYCLGAVVETRMGVVNQTKAAGKRQYSGSGLKDLWVIGEPFFRGTGVTFDLEAQKIGFRTY